MHESRSYDKTGTYSTERNFEVDTIFTKLNVQSQTRCTSSNHVSRLWSMDEVETMAKRKVRICETENRLGFAYRPMAWKPTLSAWRGTALGTKEDDKDCSPRGKRAGSQDTVPRGLFSPPRPGTTYSVELSRAAPLRVSCSLSTSHSVMHSSTRRASNSLLYSLWGNIVISLRYLSYLPFN